MSDDTVNVLCMVFPDGSVIWTDDMNTAAAQSAVDAWRARLPDDMRTRYNAAGVTGGFVVCRMLREEYRRAAAKSLPAVPASLP